MCQPRMRLVMAVDSDASYETLCFVAICTASQPVTHRDVSARHVPGMVADSEACYGPARLCSHLVRRPTQPRRATCPSGTHLFMAADREACFGTARLVAFSTAFHLARPVDVFQCGVFVVVSQSRGCVWPPFPIAAQQYFASILSAYCSCLAHMSTYERGMLHPQRLGWPCLSTATLKLAAFRSEANHLRA